MLLCAALSVNGLIKGTQVQPSYQCPNGCRGMIFVDEFLHIHRTSAHLLSVHAVDQRLFGARIFLAHAASLRQSS
jgi:predicted RNA-binding Zn ribbon-like protein